MNNPVACTYYPNEVFSKSISHQEYARILQNSHIVISTNGIDSCHSWRTAEALASGAILVTEVPVNTVDDEFAYTEGIFLYRNPEECIEICKTLMNKSESDLSRLHANVISYYGRNIAPDSRLLYRLNLN